MISTPRQPEGPHGSPRRAGGYGCALLALATLAALLAGASAQASMTPAAAPSRGAHAFGRPAGGALQETSAAREAAAAAPVQQTPAPASEPPVPEPPRFLRDVINAIGDVAGDVFSWGQSSTVTGRVLHNAFLAGQIAGLDGGFVGGDLFLFAASASVDGEVRHDVYAFTSQLRIPRDAVVHGNLLAFVGSLRIEGRVRGKLLGSAGIVVLDGQIGGGEIEAGTLRLGPNARVHGDLVYTCDNEPVVDPAAVIEGELRRKEAAAETAPAVGGRHATWWKLGWKAWIYVGNLIVGLFCLLLGGAAARAPAAELTRQPASGLGLGFVVTVVTPVACLLALLLVVTLPLGVIGLVVFLLLAFLGRLAAAQFIGAWLLRRTLRRARPSEYLSLALGLLVLMLLAEIPYVGFLARLVAVLLGVGGVYMALRAAGFPSRGIAPRRPAGSAGLVA